MLKKFSLYNFKSFQEMNNLELKDLTVIVGKNSCGKSSILQSLLLLKQTLDSPSKSPLCLEGKYLKYSNLKEVSYGLPPINSAKIGYELFFGKKEISESIKIGFKNKKDGNGYKVTIGERKIESAKVLDDDIRISDLTLTKLKKRLKKLHFKMEMGTPIGFRVTYNGFTPDMVEVNMEDTNGKASILRMPCMFFSEMETQINYEVNQSLSNIKYLSPVRAIPERAYMHYSNDASELNEDGSNSAHILWSKQNENVAWKGESINLIKAVNECISCMGLTQEISPDKVGDILYKVGIKEQKSGHNVSLADVGFGYSQILPVILLSLLNKDNGLMLLEQPEIHLHPSSAANLADLFLNFMNEEKRFLIETHSQELINRLRLRVIENPSLKDRINIVFVESDKENGSIIKQFSIDENGMFPEWPEGFLDESEKIAQAMLDARLSRG